MVTWYTAISTDEILDRLQQPRSGTLNGLATDILPPEEVLP